MKIKGYVFDCPVCYWRAHTSSLYNKAKAFQVYERKGRGKGKGVYDIPVKMDEQFREEFSDIFLTRILIIIKSGLFDKSYVKRFALAILEKLDSIPDGIPEPVPFQASVDFTPKSEPFRASVDFDTTPSRKVKREPKKTEHIASVDW
jgi:hypothetical protein